MPVTGQSRRSSTPPRTAVSAMAMAKPQGSMMPALGAKSAPHTSSESPGSIARASSPESSRSPGTPFLQPRS